MALLPTIHGITTELGQPRSMWSQELQRGSLDFFCMHIILTPCFCRFDQTLSPKYSQTEKSDGANGEETDRSQRSATYKNFVRTLLLPASSIETLHRRFDRLRDDEQQRVLSDTLRRRGYTEQKYKKDQTVSPNPGNSKVSSVPSRNMSTRIIVTDSPAQGTSAASRAKYRQDSLSENELTYSSKEMKRDQEHRDFLSHHPFHERFHNMEFLRRFPGNGVMKASKASN